MTVLLLLAQIKNYGQYSFFSAYNNFGLTISTKKTEVLFQPAPGKPYTEHTIFVNDPKFTAADKFTYLGSSLFCAVHIDDEVNIRIVKASAAFGRLRDSVWERTGTRLSYYQLFCMGAKPGQSTGAKPGT